MTDTERLDFLQKIMVEEGTHTGKCVLRQSTTGRGFRLHESSNKRASTDIRQQIDTMMNIVEGRAL